MAEIPTVNLQNVGLGTEEISHPPNGDVKRISQELYNAFATVGFVYIKNHGIDEEKISNLFQVGDKFFQLPQEIKSQSARPQSGTNQGWVARERERFNAKMPGDFKEVFNIMEPHNDNLPWPVVDRSTFKETVGEFFHTCRELSLRILDLISLGLELKDQTFMKRMHQKMESDENKTALRLLYYPAVGDQLKEGQVRCGEHSDYGSITLLFQDNVGGLEVCNRNGEFVPACPVDGTILVNIGDLLQRWTNNKLVSTRHRVGMPQSELSRSVVRHSAAFFVHPLDNAVIECLDGSDNYPSITALEYLNQRFAATYLTS